jgi:Ca2+:H+ antiporter
MCFFFGGLKYHEQSFNATVASTMSSLMAVATSSLIIPAALYATIADPEKPSFNLILQLSRGTSIVILCLYIMYLFFQLKTHTDLFQAEVDDDADEANCITQEPVLNVIEAGTVLVLVTVLVAVCAEYLVGSIEGIVESSGISKTFIGLILIPIVGNAAEHVTAIVVAMKNKVRFFCS